MKIAVNKSKDLIRKNKLVLLEDFSSFDTLEVKNKDNLGMFLEYLKSLSLEEKNIIVLKVYFEYTFEMIAQDVKVPINTVKSRYYRALKKLKDEEDLYG